MYRQFHKVRKSAYAILVSLLCGSVTSALTAVLITWLLGAETGVCNFHRTQSVTAPVAMGISEQMGGIPSMTAVLVIVTGIIGAMIWADHS